MRDLIARIEAAAGPDRELDGDIWLLVSGSKEEDGCRVPDGVWYRRDPNDRIAFEAPPAYSASLDAALSLVPEGWKWLVQLMIPKSGKPFGYAETYDGGIMCESGTAATPALALCAAALRARLAMQEASDAS